LPGCRRLRGGLRPGIDVAVATERQYRRTASEPYRAEGTPANNSIASRARHNRDSVEIAGGPP
jgi:hypothetical protein